MMYTKENIVTDRIALNYRGLALNKYKNDHIIVYGQNKQARNYAWYVLGTDFSFYFNSQIDNIKWHLFSLRKLAIIFTLNASAMP